MKDQLINHIEQLFSGANLNRENLELKEEITRNTLERYEDLIAAGRSPEEAFGIAKENIGDIHSLLKNAPAPYHAPEPQQEPKKKKGRSGANKAVNAAVTALTILSYLLISFGTHKWGLTWVIFIIGVAVNNIVDAIFDLCKGGNGDEEE